MSRSGRWNILSDTYTIVWGSRPAVWRRSRDAPSFWAAFTERSPRKHKHKRRGAQTRVFFSLSGAPQASGYQDLRRRAASYTSNNRLQKKSGFVRDLIQRTRKVHLVLAARGVFSQRPRSAASRAYGLTANWRKSVLLSRCAKCAGSDR